MVGINITNPVEIENGGKFVSNGAGIHPRRVIDSFELIFVFSGELRMQEGQDAYHLKQGDVLLLEPGVEHRGLEAYPDDLKFFWVHFRLLPSRGDTGASTQVDVSKSGQVEDESKVISLFNLLLHEQDAGRDKTTLNLILLLLIKEISVKTVQDREAKPVSLAYRAQSLIRQHYRAPITPAQISQRLQCNVDYLGRVYKDAFGMTLTEGIHFQKINAAKRDLVELNKPVNEIADELSFCDAGYFRRVFVKYSGMTPTAYRKLYSIKSVNSG